MKKQINYPRFIPRLFASTIDLFLLSVVSSPVMNIISKYLFMHIFADAISANSIDLQNLESITQIATSNRGLIYAAIILSLNIIMLAGYFIGFWMYCSATPGKLIMSTKIVDANTLEKPSNIQYIKRFFGYFLFFIGVWFMLFSKRRQALHDKISGTLVVKK
jgi:uncharacterized RDD family membrane protein YckC